MDDAKLSSKSFNVGEWFFDDFHSLHNHSVWKSLKKSRFTDTGEKWATFIVNISTPTHYSKSQIFVQKFNFDKTPTFSRVFPPNFFWQFFSWNQSCRQLKSSKPQHFHEFFTPKNRKFSRKIKIEFLDKKWRFLTVCLRPTVSILAKFKYWLVIQTSHFSSSV